MALILQDGTDAFNPDLPSEVRQLLQMSGSDYQAQLERDIALRWRYYKNEQYARDFLDAMSTLPGAEQQQAKQLWSGIKPLFNICTLASDIDRDHCFPNAKPLPVKKDDALYKRLQAKWTTHGWEEQVDFSPFYGAVLGDSHLRVIEGYLEGREGAPTRLEVYTSEVMTVLRAQDNDRRVIAAKIEYDYTEDTVRPRTVVGALQNFASGFLRPGESQASVGLLPSQEVHRKAIIITEEAYYTFRDGSLYAYGGMGNSWTNRLGVVPVIPVPFTDIGEARGLPTFHNIIPTLDAVNLLLSFTGQIFKMNTDPVLLAYGIKPGEEMKFSTTDAGTTVIHIPLPVQVGNLTQAPPRLEYLTWNAATSIGPLLEFLKMIKDDCEASIPEMQLKKSTDRTGSGFELSLEHQLFEGKMRRIRRTQYGATVKAAQLGLVADDAADETLTPDEMRTRLDEARTKYAMSIFADPILPKDRAAESQMRSVDIADGVISEYTGRLERGMTYVEALEEETRIEAEHQTAVRRARELAQATAVATGGNTQNLLPPGSRAKSSRAARGVRGRGTQPTPPTQSGQKIPAASSRTLGQPNTRSNNPNNQ